MSSHGRILLSVIQAHLALYCFAGGRLSTSLHLLYRARYLTLLVSGEDHPQVALLDVSETSPAKCCFLSLKIFYTHYLVSALWSFEDLVS